MSVICVLGMHRSGTSCLTGSLEDYGLFLGNVINSAPHNVKGNKESKRVWEINDLVLTLSDGAWNYPPAQLKWNDEAIELRNIFIESYQHQNLWGFKDPRCVLTLPFWLDAIPNMKLAGTFRHPSAVAKSLAKRNGFTLEKSLALWADYNLLLIKYFYQFNFPLVCFDWESETYQRQISKIATLLNLNTQAKSSAVRFYDGSLRTQVAQEDELVSVPVKHQKIYAELCRIAQHQLVSRSEVSQTQ